MGEVHASSEKIEFIERAFGTSEVYTKGNVQVKCPKCQEQAIKIGIPLRKRKLAINILKGDVFHCWVCSYRGRLTRVLKEYSSPYLLIEYLKRFADQKTLSAGTEEKPNKKEAKLPADFKLLALNQKSNDPLIQKALAYARFRGLSERELWYFKIGISNEWPWNNRILFPSFNSEGNFNYMVGRSWLEKPNYPYWDTPIDATSIIFNEININWNKELTITEGLLDLVKCNDNSVPLLGSDLKAYSALFGMIIKHKTPVLLAMDKDMAYKKMPSIVELFLKAGIQIRVLEMGEYGDVGEMTKEEFLRRRAEAKIWDHFSLLTHKINSIESSSIL